MLTDTQLKTIERPEGDMWKYHNQALKNPSYQLDGLMDCFREEMSYSIPYQHFSTPEPENFTLTHDSETPEWTKRQWGEVQQLKAQVLFLLNKVNKMRASASKRKTSRYKGYITEEKK